METNLFSTIKPPAPKYQGFDFQSLFVPMRDGVRLAVDIYLPKKLPAGVHVPTLLIQTRYWRSIRPRWPLSIFINDLNDLDPFIKQMKRVFTSQGYAIAYADVRGTGASFGCLRYPLDPASIEDSWDLLDWITAQSWSDGGVAGVGVSYLGLMAETLLTLGHPAVKAVIPMFNQPDLYTDVAFPGGLFNQRFIHEWSEVDGYQDQNRVTPRLGRISGWLARGVHPVNGAKAKLQQAVSQHQNNGNAFTIMHDMTFRDEVEPEIGTSIDQVCMHSKNETIHAHQVPSLGWGSWMDGATADAALRRFLTYPNADQAVIGAWNHGGRMQASPYASVKAPVDPPIDQQLNLMLHFLDAHLKTNGSNTSPERQVIYYTLGAERWQSAPSWPPPGVQNKRWYFAPSDQGNPSGPGSAGGLSLEAPVEPDSFDEYTVDRQASSGLLNRWWELSPLYAQSVEYPERAAQAKHLLLYQTPPLPNDREICGYPVISLQIASSAPDCAFYVYLEDVAPDGRVVYLTEGELRALHRKISGERPPFVLQSPYHTFKEADALPLVPGQPAEITFGLQPVSALIRAGHRLRISLAGHDADTFTPIPNEGEVKWQVFRNKDLASWIDLPVKE